MIDITPVAAGQILASAREGGMEGLSLRIAIERREDGRFHYVMGFDEHPREGDQTFESAGVPVVMDPVSIGLGQGMMLDFVELDGRMEFIFLNPNDPGYRPPAD
ncbi:MAG: iron-sulfur cluster assembly accessory protein [Thiothrix sp.]|nr:iron-sulfur cluster assembly accessory protein [Thiothrix sp.]HPQ96257.1 iron-sulfur cluster assembly accessory protein [Thiolinea sp.]